MERCEVCGRDDYHERHCPSNAGASLFPRDSAFARQSPLFKATFDEEGEPESLTMVASNQQELEDIYQDLGAIIQSMGMGQVSSDLTDIQNRIYALLR